MALKGTIKDFGVADIFQLIGQQGKTGILILKGDADEVRVHFLEGSVVRAESAVRPAQLMFGTLMVRAGVITKDQLDSALEEQRRTLKRLASFLTEMRLVTADLVLEFATLQMTETLYGLFQWNTGTYEFTQADVEKSAEGVKPIRAENILMDGIRMVDEWPGIRERLPSHDWLVELVRQPGRGSSPQLTGDIGETEMGLLALITPGRDVQRIIDLARLGEFETCRALSSLMSAGYIRVVKPSVSDEGHGFFSGGRLGIRSAHLLARIALGMVLTLAVLAPLSFADRRTFGMDPGGIVDFDRHSIERHLSEMQIVIIRRAIEVYRLETGEYPPALDVLVETDLLGPNDIRYPFEGEYFYRMKDGNFLLLPPIQ